MKELQVRKRGGERAGRDEEEASRPKKLLRCGTAEAGAPDIRLAAEELALVMKSGERKISTPAFLRVSRLLLHAIDKIGPTMAVLRRDVHGNIERLERRHVSDPSGCADLAGLLERELAEGAARKGESCARAVVWLTRSMDFGVAFVEALEKAPGGEPNVGRLVEEAYGACLKPWHGWISSAAYKVALKLVPGRQAFADVVLGDGREGGTLKGDVLALVSLLRPVLTEIHALLASFRLDNLKSA